MRHLALKRRRSDASEAAERSREEPGGAEGRAADVGPSGGVIGPARGHRGGTETETRAVDKTRVEAARHPGSSVGRAGWGGAASRG